MREVGEPIMDTVTTMPMTALASIHLDPVETLPVIERGLLLSTMTESERLEAVRHAVDPAGVFAPSARW